MIEQIIDRIEHPVKLILLTDENVIPDLPAGFATDYESMLQQADAGYLFEDFDESTIATTFYTTGTTGDPKGVYYSHRQIVVHTLGTIAGLCTGSVQCRSRTKSVPTVCEGMRDAD